MSYNRYGSNSSRSSSSSRNEPDSKQQQKQQGPGIDLPPPRYLPSRKSAVANPGFSFVTAPLNVDTARHQYANAIGKRRYKEDDDLEDDEVKFKEDENEDDLPYAPAPGSPAGKQAKKDTEDDEDDPLEAYMASLKGDSGNSSSAPPTSSKPLQPSGKPESKLQQKGIRDDIEGEDMQESYFRFLDEHPNSGMPSIDDENVIVEYDEEGNAIIPERFKIIDPLPPVDHSTIKYKPFEKNFFLEHEDIAKLSQEQLADLRQKLDVKATGFNPPKPVSSFGHFGFDDQLMELIRASEFTKPTPIQAQGIPVILAGRDLIGIAKTGSGKTCAYLWPLFVHIMDQPELKPGDGPIGLICAPTRELALQIYTEAKHFGKVYNITSICCYGGGNMWEQEKACKAGAEIIVCTPGRIIDLVKHKATNLERVTFLVFDEADRMFDMGFEAQVRSIANHVRPDRQTLMFSATFKKRVERVARAVLTDPIRVLQGDLGEANEDIKQIPLIFNEPAEKWFWLVQNLVQFCVEGQVLIFVTRKANSDELATNLRAKDFKIGLIHGDLHQTERNDIITKFKKGEMPILVATDVAARGLDIPAIKTVINYDVARDIDTHIHRIGRTGRAGTQGTAYTLLSSEKDKDKEFAAHFVKHLEASSITYPDALLDLALKAPWFEKQREKQEVHYGATMGTTSEGVWIGHLSSGGDGGGSDQQPHGRGRGPMGKRVRTGLATSEEKSMTASTVSQPAEFYSPTETYYTEQAPQADNKPMDRLSAMRSAFSMHFRSSFIAASDETAAKPTITPEQLEADLAKKKKKSRWD